MRLRKDERVGGLVREYGYGCDIARLHPNADQEVVNCRIGIFAVRRHNPQSGQTIVAIHNVTAQEQSLAQETMGIGADWSDLQDELGRPAPIGGQVTLLYQSRWLCLEQPQTD